MTAHGSDADENSPIAQHWLISGRVQGVGYRMWLEAAARQLGAGGWVRNLEDGRVEAVVAGPPEQLRRLAASAQRGPRQAAVDRVQVGAWSEPVGSEPFRQRANASMPEGA